MRKGFTLVEALCVILVSALVASICYPVFWQVKRASSRSMCMSHLHQFGMAIQLYRSDAHGSESGTPAQMGMPSHATIAADLGSRLKCRGVNWKGNPGVYTLRWPNPADHDPEDPLPALWGQYTEKRGSSAVMVSDENHQDSLPRSWIYQSWRSTGLRLDGSTFTREAKGFPMGYRWWYD